MRHRSSQELHVAVFDSEDDNFNTFADALLGVVAVPMSTLYDAGDGTGPVELTLPLDCSVYDGKLKAYHATRTPEPSFVTLRAMLDLDDEPDRGAAGARAARLAGATAGATFVALTYAATTAAVLCSLPTRVPCSCARVHSEKLVVSACSRDTRPPRSEASSSDAAADAREAFAETPSPPPPASAALAASRNAAAARAGKEALGSRMASQCAGSDADAHASSVVASASPAAPPPSAALQRFAPRPTRP